VCSRAAILLLAIPFSIFVEIVEFSQFFLFLVALPGKVASPAWAIVDVPPPEAAQQRVRALVVMSPKLAVFADMCHNCSVI
jgi:hypothetical protein